jgi:N-succinyldiaminopimelate aminotransferase
VTENRAAYREKMDRVVKVLGPALPVHVPDGGFYLWLRVPGGGEAFARRLYAEAAVTVLPGAYLGREVDGVHPGTDYARVALVDDVATCVDAATRIRGVLEAS